MTDYKNREISVRLLEALTNMPVVVLSGMRQTGKSTLLLNQPQLRTRAYYSFDDYNTLEAARSDPESILSGDKPVTIDEAHKYPEILSIIKQAVDKKRVPGRFLLSGSANFLLLKTIADSLAGRAVYVNCLPFSRREIMGVTKTKPALIQFLDTGVFPKCKIVPVKRQEVINGGMPVVCLGQVQKPVIWFRGYEQTYLERDVRTLSQVADLVSFRHLIQLLALRNAQVLNISELARDAKLNVMTTSRYLDLLEVSCVISRMPPHLGNPASRLIKSPKIYFTDSGLASYIAGIRDRVSATPLAGALFECYIAQNLQSILSAYAPDVTISYWHIQGRHEVDFILEHRNETVAIEIKHSKRWHKNDLAGLKKYLDSTPHCRAALFAYNGSESYSIDDRLYVIPVSLLLS
jgi:predicted AAA+ superfamily ATPase